MEKTIREGIETNVKNSVGYMEAENKDSFMIGVSVAISRAEQHYEPLINQLKDANKNIQQGFYDIWNDIITLQTIFRKYSRD